jgi:hypothetical protein
MGQPSPPELSPAMSGALLFGADRKGRVDVHHTHIGLGAELARAMHASSIVETISRQLTTAIGRSSSSFECGRRVALELMANPSRGECHVRPQNLLIARRR